MITWKLTTATLNGDRLSISIQGVTGQDGDGNDIGESYSLSVYKTETLAKIKSRFKELINTDRTKSIDETTLKSKVDLANFETYLNT